MNYHGFRTVEDFVNSWKRQGTTVVTYLYGLASNDEPIPESILYCTVITDSVTEEKTEFPIYDRPPALVVIAGMFPTTKSEFCPDGIGQTWMIFSTDLDVCYAEGWSEDYKILLSAWGYAPITR